jgi:predicted deacylase
MNKNIFVPENPNDLELAISLVKKIAAQRGFTYQELGFVDSCPIILLTPKTKSAAQKILVAAGFHGNEYAGVWGLINYLQHGSRFENVSFLPLVSPIAFKENRRYGKDNKISNQGFCHPEMNLTPSDEGKILISHAELLLSLGKDGFISLHEAPEKDMFYVYAFEKGDQPSSIAKELLRVGAKEFGAAAEGTTMQYGGTAKDGIIFNFHDSSFEDFMFENGVPHSIVTETPMSGNLEQRIKTIKGIVDTFIRLVQA